MVEIQAPNDCGNAPRKRFLKEFHRAFAEGEIDFLMECLSDRIEWEMVGERILQGKDAFFATLEEMNAIRPSRVILHHVITHGKEAAVYGERHGDGGEVVRFCDVYLFQGAKGNILKSIRSFVVTRKGAS